MDHFQKKDILIIDEAAFDENTETQVKTFESFLGIPQTMLTFSEDHICQMGSKNCVKLSHEPLHEQSLVTAKTKTPFLMTGGTFAQFIKNWELSNSENRIIYNL